MTSCESCDLSENYGKEDSWVKSHTRLQFCNLGRRFKIAFLRDCMKWKTLPFPQNLIKSVSRIWGWLLISQGNGVSAGIWLIFLFTQKLQYITWSSPCFLYTVPEALTHSVPWCSKPAIQLHTPAQLYRWFPVPGMLSPPPPASESLLILQNAHTFVKLFLILLSTELRLYFVCTIQHVMVNPFSKSLRASEHIRKYL